MTPKAKRFGVAAAIATALAIPAEGLYHYAYYDPPGILTVCYGSTRNVVRNRYYTLAECRLRLSSEMLEAIETVDRCHPGLPENVLAAFGDAVYNIGPKIACGPGSTADKFLDQGRLVEACNQLPRWNKARVAGVMIPLPGLTKRRATEQRVCLEGLV